MARAVTLAVALEEERQRFARRMTLALAAMLGSWGLLVAALG